jgi:hypothetical protein
MTPSETSSEKNNLIPEYRKKSLENYIVKKQMSSFKMCQCVKCIMTEELEIA